MPFQSSGEVEEAYAALVAYSGAVEAGAAPLGGACGGRGDRVEAASGAATCACDAGFHGPTCAYDDAAWAERTAYAASLLGHRDAVAALQPPSDAATRVQARARGRGPRSRRSSSTARGRRRTRPSTRGVWLAGGDKYEALVRGARKGGSKAIVSSYNCLAVHCSSATCSAAAREINHL